jgi:hypothetical protein
MKKIFLLFFTGYSLLACKNDGAKQGPEDSLNQDKKNLHAANANNKSVSPNAVDSANLTSITWLDTQELNMGKITEGQKLEVNFRFKNSGTKPLVISKVWAQCGCTVPETPKEPFAPGQEGVIKAIFDSQGRGGSANTKEVYVNANTDPVTNVLVFNVDVAKKEN